ncbi:MAG: hypothetical protein ABW185_16195 [Sedimenticola sp.]
MKILLRKNLPLENPISLFGKPNLPLGVRQRLAGLQLPGIFSLCN